jgi:hypothetical protein
MSTHAPQPGQIWEVCRSLYPPLATTAQPLYSEIAQSFLQGDGRDRYVLILTEPAQSIVSVMVLSPETQHQSDADVLIPHRVSGLDALLAETWHIQETLVDQLSHPVGQRLSRSHYDLLLEIAETSQPHDTAFHQAEVDWSDVLTVPLAAYQAHQQGIVRSQQVLAEALQIEQELAQVPLSQWLNGLVTEGWQQFQAFWAMQPSLAIAVRGSAADPEAVDRVLQQLQTTVDGHHRKRLIKQLGDIGAGSSAAIAQLVEILRSTQDDEIIWAAVESLWQLDPGNPAAGVRQVKLVDFGMQLAGQSVALAVALVPKANQQVGVLLQVYPIGEVAFLPTQLKLVLLDQSGQLLREVLSRQADVFIQLKLSGVLGEAFSVRLELANTQITEDFVI